MENLKKILTFIALLLFTSCNNSVDTVKLEKNIPIDIVSYIKENESKVPNLRLKTEKTIIWANPQKKDKTKFSIIYIHGFTGTRQETYPLADIIAKKIGANLFYTRLTGHGLDGESLAKATMNDWLGDALEALEIGRRIGEKVVIIGSSTGGTLATWLAQREDANNIYSLVLLSPNFGLKDYRSEFITLPGAKYIVPLIAGKNITWKPLNSKHAGYWTMSYPYIAAIPMMELVKMVRKSKLEKINIPVLTIFSPKDSIININKLEYVQSKLGSKQKKIVKIEKSLNDNNHILAGDILAPDNTEFLAKIITDFIHAK
ncbi:MAG: alpha/beta hydrolase [Desulfobacterales bacterium]|nr:alpha/beta hydrolase [Desulfobacterales bacterium]